MIFDLGQMNKLLSTEAPRITTELHHRGHHHRRRQHHHRHGYDLLRDFSVNNNHINIIIINNNTFKNK